MSFFWYIYIYIYIDIFNQEIIYIYIYIHISFSFALGDPTVFGNLLPHESMLLAVEDSLRSHRNNGYLPAIGKNQQINQILGVNEFLLKLKVNVVFC